MDITYHQLSFTNVFFSRWDYIVDDATPNRGKQIYEKMISGMYVGELVRQILIDMVQQKLMFKVGIFSGRIWHILKEKNTDGLLKNDFKTEYMSKIEADPVGEYTKCRQVAYIKRWISHTHIYHTYRWCRKLAWKICLTMTASWFAISVMGCRGVQASSWLQVKTLVNATSTLFRNYCPLEENGLPWCDHRYWRLHVWRSSPLHQPSAKYDCTTDGGWVQVWTDALKRWECLKYPVLNNIWTSFCRWHRPRSGTCSCSTKKPGKANVIYQTNTFTCDNAN